MIDDCHVPHTNFFNDVKTYEKSERMSTIFQFTHPPLGVKLAV